jgi:hypothetical protein
MEPSQKPSEKALSNTTGKNGVEELQKENKQPYLALHTYFGKY